MNYDIVVSLTSTPDRINSSQSTIKSILRQSYLPKKIIFNIPCVSSKGVEYIIPDWLNRYTQEYPIIHINRCNKDYGPATKIIPTIELYKDNQDQKIIFIDDDQIYPKNLVKNLFIESTKQPDKAFCGFGQKIKYFIKTSPKTPSFYFILGFLVVFGMATILYFILKNKAWGWLTILITILLFTSIYAYLTYRKEIDIFFGVSGVLVKPRFFDWEVLSNVDTCSKPLFFNDDVNLSGMLKEKGIKLEKVFIGIPIPVFHKNFFKTLAWTENNGFNNTKEALKYYNW